MQLANVFVVLPFICAQQGQFLVAGLLFPAYCVGVVLGNSLSPYVLQRVQRNKHLIIACLTTLMAVLVLACAVSASTSLPVAVVFLVAASGIGLMTGVQKVAYSEIISSKLADLRRGDLMLTQGALGAVGAIVTALLLLPFLALNDPAHSQINVLWLGAASLIAAAVTSTFFGPVAPTSTRKTPLSFRETYREGAQAARSQSWFRRYALVQVLFVPVLLGSAFYSMHASVNHGGSAGSLNVLVISSSIGLIVGSMFWRVVNRKLGPRWILVVSGLLGTAAATICVVIEYNREWDHVWVYGMVFVFATVAGQAISTALLSWMNFAAAQDQRGTLIGFGALVVAVASSILGAILGTAAQDASVIVPIIVILGLNVVAAGVAFRMAPTRRDMAIR